MNIKQKTELKISFLDSHFLSPQPRLFPPFVSVKNPDSSLLISWECILMLLNFGIVRN